MNGLHVTPKQDSYVRALARRLSLPIALLDNHCVARFGKPYLSLDRAQVSALIDEMIGWEALPAGLMRAKGKIDLF